ncbi:DUF3307 domain-containing protein [Epibacterium ulvae]|uniref:DUF3307 domain-containing protein n=1 Tax=Epibacterium ulvae TaxID=1156985 RepID=A0A1G5PN14_9RHOB|nr:DUF3307 domain-containing protein [Epibacterium ulvae]SCZ50500.1 Protein of unknown function [Epibacterium ulvae]
MPDHVGSLLLLLCLLQVKHMFADFFLQTPRMLSGRGAYLHLGRAQHATVHFAGSVIALLIMAAPLVFLLTICIIEWIIHFHIDYGKAKYNERKCLTPTQSLFWWAMGTDQALHQLTYVAMGWAWCAFVLS